MACRRFIGILAAAVLVCLAGPLAAADAPKPISLIFDTNENPPFTYGVGTEIRSPLPGLVIELLRAASAHAAVPIELTRVPWARGLELIQAAEADGIFMSSYTQDRLAYGVYPMKDGKPDVGRKLVDLSYWLYVRQDSGVDWDGKAIINLQAPIGATTGFAIIPMLRSMGVTVVEDPVHLRNLYKLIRGEIDGYAELQAHVERALRDHPKVFDTIVKLPTPLRTTPYYLMFSKPFYAASPDRAERLWDAIAWVNAQPEFRDRIRTEYTD